MVARSNQEIKPLVPFIEKFEKLMTVEELADAFGFAPQTIRNWVALRSIPYLRIGGKTRFRKKSIEAWLERKESRLCL